MAAAGVILPSLWLGLIIGAAFLAMPRNGRATLRALATARDGDGMTLASAGNAEWLMLTALTLVVLAQKSMFSLAATGTLDLLLVIQTGMLSPVWNRRAAVLTRASLSFDSLSYVMLDVLKVSVLAAIIWKQAAFD